MDYTKDEVIQYVKMEDVRFIRIAFCDVFGKIKNIAIQPSELARAFEYGIGIDGSAIKGFGGSVHSDMLLHPDPATLSSLPWRSENGRVVRMYCAITHPDGTPLEADCRTLLKNAVQCAEDQGISFNIGSEMEFYLFKTDENGEPTRIPHDHAGYMDIAPEDKGENVRREICLTLSQMDIHPESSHHEEGPGQNEIDFRYSDPLKAADNTQTFKSVVKSIASRHGLYADFSPKPLSNEPDSGLHINVSVQSRTGEDVLPFVMAGIMAKAREMTAFLNPVKASYKRLGSRKAPAYVSWSAESRSQLIRVPAGPSGHTRLELRSPDPAANPYLAFALIIYAGLYGIQNRLPLPDSADIDLYNAPSEILDHYDRLPASHKEAVALAMNSDFIHEHIPETVLKALFS